MSPIKDFTLTYDVLNEEDTFSEGDTVAGTVTFTLTKETKVKSLLVKFKGDAHVHWTEGSGDNKKSHSAHRSYFKLKEYILAENAKGTKNLAVSSTDVNKGTVLPQGVHQYRFNFIIPQEDMPTSFKGSYGKIMYMLEAKISRSWRFPSKEQRELNFVTKSIPHLDQCPQSESVDKDVGVFSKGEVQMSATVNKKVCSPGDTLSVVAKICNSSSKNMKPKFSLHQKTVHHAGSATKTIDKVLCKIAGDNITPKSEETVSCELEVPVDVIPTLRNCDILSVDCYVKVYLDISFAFDPEVVFPLVIVPVEPYAAGVPGAPSYSDFPPPALPVEPYPAPAGPGAYGYLAPDANTTSGFNNQEPQQQATPYGFSAAALPPSPVQNQDATAPPQQGEQHPTYCCVGFFHRQQ